MSYEEAFDTILARIPPAPPLAPPEGAVVRVSTGEELARAVTGASPGETILLADGVHEMPPGVTLTASDVAIRGESARRERAVIDGTRHHMDRDAALLTLKGASDVLIADLTFRNSRKYGVMLYGDSGIRGFRAHDVVFRNIWARGLKGTTALHLDDDRANPAYAPEVVARVRPRGGDVRHCLFVADHPKTFLEDGFGGDYIAGVDMMHLSGWTFAENAFVGLRGHSGGGRGAIFIWIDSEDIAVERNLFFLNDRSIALGNPSYDGVSVRRASVRGNTIVAGRNKAIECWGTREVDVSGNRVFATDLAFPLTAHFAGGSGGGRCRENVIHGHLVAEEGVLCERNAVGDLAGAFRDPSRADLELTSRGRELASGAGIARP